MYNYLYALPIVFLFLSFRFFSCYYIACISLLTLASYQLFNNELLSNYFLYKEELSIVGLVFALLVVAIVKKSWIVIRIKFFLMILISLFVYKNIFITVIACEFFRLFSYVKRDKESIYREIISVIIKTFFIFALFQSVDMTRILSGDVSYTDLAILPSLVVFALFYLIDFAMEYFSRVRLFKGSLEKALSYLVFLLIFGKLLSELDLHSTYIFDYINDYKVQFNLFLVLLAFAYYKFNLRMPLLLIGSLFSSVYYFNNISYFILLSLPIIVFIYRNDKWSNSIKKIVRYDEAMLPFSYSFLVFVVPTILGGDFIRCSVVVLVSIHLYLYNNSNRKEELIIRQDYV